MKFHYKAKNKDGEAVEGVKEAKNRSILAREMKADGFFLISAEEVDQTRGRRLLQKINTSLGRVSLKEKIVFASNLSAMIVAGLSLTRALSVIERQTTNVYFRGILTDIIDQISRGGSLSGSLKNYPAIFPEVFTAMVAAGEESGNLPGSLEVVADQMKKSYDLRRKVRGAMIYPAIIIVVIILIAALMMIFLVPTLTATFTELEVELPLSTRLVIMTSDFMANNIMVTLGGFLIFALGSVWYGRTDRGRLTYHYLLLHLPVIKGLVIKVNSAIIMRNISSLISSGVSMLETLRITRRIVANVYYKEAIDEALEKVQKGIGLSSVFSNRSHLFPVLVAEMALVGEETGNLPVMLLNGAKFFEEEVDQATKNLSTIIEPVLMVFIGLAVGFFAISMIGPMYSLSSAI
ncbi:MAG: type II secretion system F family protein [Candidatus Paceibacterota bacterium]